MDARWTGGRTTRGPRGRYFRAKKSKETSVPSHEPLRNFVRLLQRPANLFTESHCRADFLVRCHYNESGAAMTNKFFLHDFGHWDARPEEPPLLANARTDS